MIDYDIVNSTVRPKEKVVDEYSVWVNTDIAKAQADLEYIAMMTEVELE